MQGDPRDKIPATERWLEATLFASRWLMAPFYLGLVLALAALLVVFAGELATELSHVLNMTPEGAILMGLSLIDLSLAGNLLLIVIFSGYENFVSKLDVGDRNDRPVWMGTVDFTALKLKLISSIVAIWQSRCCGASSKLATSRSMKPPSNGGSSSISPSSPLAFCWR